MNKKKQSFAATGILLSVKYLFHELYNYKYYSILLPFLGCAAQISLSLITIYMPKIVLDAVEQNVHMNHLLYRTSRMGILFALAMIANMVAHNAIESCSQTFLYTKLITLWERKVMNLDYEIYLSNNGKILMEKARYVISSPNWGVVTFLSKITVLLEDCVGLLVYCGIISALHPVIVVFLLLLFGIEMWFGLRTEKRKQSVKEEQAKINRRLNYIAYGTRGMQEGKDIRIYSMAAFLRQIAQTVVSDKREVEEKVQKWQFQNMLLVGSMIFIRDGAAYLYLIYRFLHTGMSIGDFTLYFAAITAFGNWLTKLTEGVSDFVEVSNDVTDFREFMELREDEKENKYLIEKLQQPLSFSFKNVCFSYLVEDGEQGKEIPVLNNINLTIKAGESIAIVGVNGAGKSTLVKLLCGMLRPNQGSILVNGIDSTEFAKREYYGLFSAVFQKSGVLPVSIAENIMLNTKKENDTEAMWECIRMAGLEEKIKSLPQGVDSWLVKHISESGIELSGGEEQRLLLARALYKNASVLLLDEPTAALDSIAENEIYQKYHQFTKGKTAVFISHRLASTRFCDKIILMEQGKIIESGTHEELMELGGKYAEMFQVQSQYYKNDKEKHSEMGGARE